MERTTSRRTGTGASLDVRGPRVGAAVTTAVLATAVVVQGTVGVVLLALQTVQFVAGVALGPARSPYGRLFRLLRDRLGVLGPPAETEPAGPPRFAQGCGLAFAGGGLVAVALGAPAVGWVLAGVVLALSALLALTGVCLGCEMYLLTARLRPADGDR